MQKQPFKEHWLLKITPIKYKALMARCGYIGGALSWMILMASGYFAILFWPLFFSILTPKAPIAQPVIWLQRHLNPDAFFYAYMGIAAVFLCLIFIGISFLRIKIQPFPFKTAKDKTESKIS